MKTSARNHFTGTLKDMMKKGAVTTEVIVRVADEIDVVAAISTRPADALGLAVGKPAHVLIKASSFVVAID